MGKVIIIYRFGKRESLKCKSRERALEIVKKRHKERCKKRERERERERDKK